MEDVVERMFVRRTTLLDNRTPVVYRVLASSGRSRIQYEVPADQAPTAGSEIAVSIRHEEQP